VINISNHTSEDIPSWSAVLVVLTQPLTTAKVTGHSGGRPLGARIRNIPDWLVALPRRWGDRWFAMNDAEAEWRGPPMTRVHVGLDRGEAEGGDDEEPALNGSPGHYRSFG
jgi:hypothetical protein